MAAEISTMKSVPRPAISGTGLCLALSGLASFIGVIGIITGTDLLANGSVLGGGLFLLSMLGMLFLFRNSPSR